MTYSMPGPRQHDLDRHPHAEDGNSEMMCGLCWLAELGTPDPYHKHLSDAECAAEYWREQAEWWGGMHQKGPTAEGVDIRRAVIWERFATQPHAIEQDTKWNSPK